MKQEFNGSDSYINRDDEGTPREVVHTDQKYISEARTAQLAAREYLEKHGKILAIKVEELRNLTLAPETKLINASVEYRFLQEKTQFDMTTIVFQQTYYGLPIWEAALAVHMKHDPFRIVSAQSTSHSDLEVKKPTAQALSQLERLDDAQLLPLLGLSPRQKEYDLKSFKIQSKRLIIYRYESVKRMPGLGKPSEREESAFATDHPILPLPPVGKGIEERQHSVAVEVHFILGSSRIPDLRWVAIIEATTLSVLYLRAFVDNVNGMVFRNDPMTDNGGPLPSANNASLNAVRTSELLQGLNAPVAGTQSLSGSNVTLTDPEAPTVAPPTELVGADFNFDARTNNFAAVNAYYHCDRFFRLLQDLGFSLASYLGGTTLPSTVDHRGSMNTANGVEVNAHCLGTGSGGILRTTFALADTGDTANPIGIAADWRVVLHELCGHGILYNHVNSANFGFAHSAGDSFAAILNDPSSLAYNTANLSDPNRFITFPWVNIGRRHDRAVTAGWGWGGVNDVGGYNSEQILCTTHFRIYRSIGGDSNQVARRQFAARFTAYLILRAIGSLTPATNPSNVSGYATALITADLGDWTSEGQSGGAYGKVIRWAFEKQGLYQPTGAPTPVTAEGAPPMVDVYIDDGRKGEYQYQPNHWSCQAIWNRRIADGLTGHEEPALGETNYAYVKIKNRGTSVANNTVVKGYHCKPLAGLLWPNDLQPMTTPQLTAGTLQPNNTEEKTIGPFEWIPVKNAWGQDSMLMIVSANGDPSNVDNFTTGEVVEDWRLVPNDNNVAQRKVTFPPRLALMIADAGNFGNVCVGSFKDEMLCLSNSGYSTLKVNSITSSSGEFLVPSVLSYPLAIEAGNSLEVPIRFQPTSFGSKSATITVASDDPIGPKTMALSGTARAPRLAMVIGDTGNFGNACIGSFVDEMMSLSNSGHCTLTITSITSSSGEFLVAHVFSYPLAIEAGGSLQVPIRLQPTSFGPKSAKITVTSDDPAGPLTVTVSGNAPPGKLAVTGSTCFGNVECGIAQKTVSICNVGECSLHVTSVGFSRKRRHFKLLNNPFPATLRPGSCLGVVIQYKASCDPECCELVITSDDPTTPIKTLDVVAYTRCEEKCERERGKCECKDDEHDGHEEEC